MQNVMLHTLALRPHGVLKPMSHAHLIDCCGRHLDVIGNLHDALPLQVHNEESNRSCSLLRKAKLVEHVMQAWACC